MTVPNRHGDRPRRTPTSSFNGRAPDELFNIEEFGSVGAAKVIVENWRAECNTYRPQGSLGELTQVEYHRQRTIRNRHDGWTT